MMNYSDLTVILPTLNEAGNIRPLIDQIQSVLPSVHVIVVDDNSQDGTALIVERLCKKNHYLQLIQRSGNPCLTASIDLGIRAAKTEYVGWMDADFSHPPEVLEKLYHASKATGCCIGTRYGKQEKYDDVILKESSMQKDSFAASLLSSFLNFSVYYLLKLRISDYTSGFIVCRRDLLLQHALVGDYGEYFIELMCYLNSHGVTIKELPYTSPPRTWGESKTGTTIITLIRRGMKYIILVSKLVFKKYKTKIISSLTMPGV